VERLQLFPTCGAQAASTTTPAASATNTGIHGRTDLGSHIEAVLPAFPGARNREPAAELVPVD
jgi:hypothetical protein